MSYIPHTKKQQDEMLEAIGLKSKEDLFCDIKPELRPKEFDLPSGLSEFEVLSHIRNLGLKNQNQLVNFVGAGFYDHFIPASVDALAQRPEFYTAYTPYQPESSQGWLQAIYEYQSVIAQLTGMEAANASMYDGGTALFEAAMMAIRTTKRNKIIMDSGLNMIYRTMMYTYTSNLDIEFIETRVVHGQSSRDEIFKHLDDKTAAVILQNPNFFGAVDDYSDVIDKAHSLGALGIVSVYPVSLGILKAPGEMRADIVTGEGQSLGLPLSFGGPYLGFLATNKKFIRKMPGRVVGATEDKDGKRGFVLTLQAREQHIRRQKATSNICSNESLCALRALIYLCLLGKKGLIDLARLNYDKAEYAKSILDKIKGVEVKRSSPTFNEFTVKLPKNADEVVSAMYKKGFACGFPLGRFYKDMDNYLLMSVTEKRTKNEIEHLVKSLEEVLCS
jgi:glycine dehydrogenase subunit 1